MAISIRFIGTGKPVSPATNPRIDREPSRKGIEFSGITTSSEFRQNIQSRLDVPPVILGRNAVTITRLTQSGFEAIG